MQAFVLSFVAQYGYLALAALIFLENVFPPIPSEAILPAAGFMSSIGSLWLPSAVLAATIGSLLGAYVLYGVGRVLSQERLERLMGTKPLRMLGFEPGDVSSAIGWFNKHGRISVLVCRCIPVVRSLISIPAGISGMGVLRFSAYTFLGSLAWNTVLCTLGYVAGSAWESASAGATQAIDVMTLVVIAIIVVVAAIWAAKRAIPAIKNAVRSEGAE
jgi:membrane protein DedA with SNARE-associated domain